MCVCVQITEVQVQVTENTEALKEAHTTFSESRRSIQSLQIELQSQISLVRMIILYNSYQTISK